MILQIAAIALSSAIIAFSAKGILNVAEVISWRLKERKEFFSRAQSPPKTYFYIIIPALREQNVIERTLSRLGKFNYDKSMYEIVLALDHKESLSEKRSTLSVAKEYASKRKNELPKISFVEYTGTGQKRALQLNAALEVVKAKSRSKEDCIVGIYDADSHPDLNTLAYIDMKRGKDKEMVAFQQMLSYVLNSKDLKKKRFGSLLLGNAYYQTIWNYIFEVKQFFNANIAISKGRQPLLPPYCMGHGEFFSVSTLKSVGGFPLKGPADGIQIGFLLSLKGIKINPIPFDDYCESPESLGVIFRQHAFWFCGNINFFTVLKQHGYGLARFIQQIFHAFLSAKWIARPFIYIIALAMTIYAGVFAATAALIITPFAYYITAYYLIAHFSKNDKDFEATRLRYLGLEVILAMAFKSLGAINGLIKILRRSIFGTEPAFKKIER